MSTTITAAQAPEEIKFTSLTPQQMEYLTDPVYGVIEEKQNDDFENYFHESLHTLFNERRSGKPVFMYTLFIRSLMNMCIKPENAEFLKNNFGLDAHIYFDNLFSFFDNNITTEDVHMWCDYMSIHKYFGSLTVKQVQQIHDEYVPKQRRNNIYDLLDERYLKSYLGAPPKSNGFEFKNNDELVAALNRHFPGKQWEARKLAIASHPEMKAKLQSLEEERLLHDAEAPAQEQARELQNEVRVALLHLHLGNPPKEKPVTPPTKKPAPAKKPANKPTTTRKKA